MVTYVLYTPDVESSRIPALRKEKGCPPEGQIELLNEDMLDAVSGGGGGLTQQEKLDALHTWIYYVMGFGDR